MQQWEYLTCKIVSPGVDHESHSARMQRLGEEGWELCGVGDLDDHGYRMFFKRQKISSSVSDGSPYR